MGSLTADPVRRMRTGYPKLRALVLLVQKRLRGPGADVGARRRLRSNGRGLAAPRQPDATGEAGP